MVQPIPLNNHGPFKRTAGALVCEGTLIDPLWHVRSEATLNMPLYSLYLSLSLGLSPLSLAPTPYNRSATTPRPVDKPFFLLHAVPIQINCQRVQTFRGTGAVRIDVCFTPKPILCNVVAASQRGGSG